MLGPERSTSAVCLWPCYCPSLSLCFLPCNTEPPSYLPGWFRGQSSFPAWLLTHVTAATPQTLGPPLGVGQTGQPLQAGTCFQEKVTCLRGPRVAAPVGGTSGFSCIWFWLLCPPALSLVWNQRLCETAPLGPCSKPSPANPDKGLQSWRRYD